MSFRIAALAKDEFTPLFALPETALAARLARRVTATSKPGFPCRVSLRDGDIGETLILMNYTHQQGKSPFRASHAIFVRQAAIQAFPEVDEVPAFFLSRALSLRGFDAAAMMQAAELVEGRELAHGLDALLAISNIACVHIHFAGFGCYAARAVRAE